MPRKAKARNAHRAAGNTITGTHDNIRQRGDIVPLEQNDVFKAAQDHLEYTFNSSTLKNLPEFDTCKGVIPQSIFETLLQDEIQKLIDFSTSESPPPFSSDGTLEDMTAEGLKQLSGLIEQILSILDIVEHDNARLVISAVDTIPEAWKSLLGTRKSLQQCYAPTTHEIEGREPVKLGSAKSNFTAYCRVLDYSFSLTVWWIIRCVHSGYIARHVVATLARLAVKMKLVARDPKSIANQALSDTYGELDTQRSRAKWQEPAAHIVQLDSRELKINVLEGTEDKVKLYLLEKFYLRICLRDILVSMLSPLRTPATDRTPINCFEICAIIQSTGLEGYTTMISSTRRGDVLTTADLAHISSACSICPLLEKIICQTKSQRSGERPGTPKSAVEVRYKYYISDIPSKPSDLSSDITKMDDLLPVLASTALLSRVPAAVVVELTNLASVVAPSENIAIFKPPPRNIGVECTITTDIWKSRLLSQANTVSDVCPLSQSPFRNEAPTTRPLSLSREDLTLIRRGTGIEQSKKVKDENKTTREGYARVSPAMKQWEMGHSSITVNCPRYVAFAVSLAGLIVCGGLVIPFTVGERIKGVDPFQLAFFCWGLAGLLLVIANSRYVSNWPWHDFLKGRMVCQSLSALSDVSGIDEQLILVFLLQTEWKTKLRSSGPYNGMFKRRAADSDPGFSIDVPVSLSTLFASGFVLLKVTSQSGDSLVCLDGRRGGWDAARRGKTGNWMTCPDLRADFLETMREGNSQGDAYKEERVFKLERSKFSWEKVLGVYVKETAKFG